MTKIARIACLLLRLYVISVPLKLGRVLSQVLSQDEEKDASIDSKDATSSSKVANLDEKVASLEPKDTKVKKKA